MPSPYTAVLVVDFSSYREDIMARLREAGVIAACADASAKARVYIRNLRFDLVLVDLDEDEAGAKRLLEEVGRWQPGAVRLTSTRNGASVRGFPLLRKPFGVDDLLRYAG
jgi:DNA-binding NtrC family response regulator